MENNIEKILTELVVKTADQFNLDSQDALAAVAQSKLAAELCDEGIVHNLNINQLCEKLFEEIAYAG